MIVIITGIILAAGSSKRMGRQKLLLPLKDNTIIGKVIETVKRCKLYGEILVVYQSVEVMVRTKEYDVKTVYNEKAEDGQSTSVIAGIRNSDSHTNAYMFIAGDQPFITVDIIEELICTWKQNQTSIVIPKYDGKRGMPTIFPVSFKQELMNITGDTGGRTVIENNLDKVIFVDFSYSMAGFDIDTPEDYKTLLKEI